MVDYSTWTKIGHEIYKEKGGTYRGKAAAPQLTSTLAAFWRENKDQLKSASRSEARQIARQNMTV